MCTTSLSILWPRREWFVRMIHWCGTLMWIASVWTSCWSLFWFEIKPIVQIIIPRKRFFLQLVANYVHNVNTKVVANGLSLAKKVKICCSFSLDLLKRLLKHILMANLYLILTCYVRVVLISPHVCWQMKQVSLLLLDYNSHISSCKWNAFCLCNLFAHMNILLRNLNSMNAWLLLY